MENTNKTKKKILGMPVVLFIIMSVGMVLAIGGVVFYYQFYQSIEVHGLITKPEIIPLVITGDLAPRLNCVLYSSCTTDWINITNPTNYFQPVKVEAMIPYTSDGLTFEGVYNGSFDGTSDIANFSVVIDPGQTVSFRIKYYMIDVGEEEFYSYIGISSNMTQISTAVAL